MWNVRNLFFFHTLTETHFGEKNFFSPYKSIKLRKISRFFPNISKIFGLSGKGVPPPILKFFFFADLHYLGHERKKIKKCENDPILSWPPPPKCEISHFFFFRTRPSLSLTLVTMQYRLHSLLSRQHNNYMVVGDIVGVSWPGGELVMDVAGTNVPTSYHLSSIMIRPQKMNHYQIM